jgi:hypothetical protein
MMTSTSDKKGSATRPILIPPLKDIIKEGNQEIGRQAREAVEKAVTSGIAVDPARLRKWGPDGATYFARKLRERIMPPALPTTPPSDGDKPMMDGPVIQDQGPEETEISDAVPHRPIALIRTEKDWIAQESERRSIATRSIFRGQLIAVSLLVLFIAVLLMWS